MEITVFHSDTKANKPVQDSNLLVEYRDWVLEIHHLPQVPGAFLVMWLLIASRGGLVNEKETAVACVPLCAAGTSLSYWTSHKVRGNNINSFLPSFSRGLMLHILCVLSFLIFITTLWGKYSCPFFLAENGLRC